VEALICANIYLSGSLLHLFLPLLTVVKVYLEQVSRRFQTTAAIEAITFEVPDGEFWVLVGPSGCGKSTILRLIAGLEMPTAGSIYFGEQLMNQVPARQRDVAMVFQNYALYPHMTVAENLAFGLRLRGVEPDAVKQRVEAAARALNIAHLLDRKPKQLSGGQQQRVALGRAIVRQPQVFLLDEPLSNLDAQLRDETRAELKQLHQQLGITTIYVTHDQVEAMTLADQVVVLNQGKIQQISDPQTLYARPINQMVATFLGSPPMNILPARYDGSAFHVGDSHIPYLLSYQLPSPEVNLGIRPEHLSITSNTSDTAHLSAIVTVIEPLGREQLVRAKLVNTLFNNESNTESHADASSLEAIKAGAITVQFWATANQPVQVGERLALQLDLHHLLIFARTGENLALSA
jgi:multiple sugar transport system ATP-binding protein